eukprot:5530629-Pleurochrysis_carterae.AAC.7
MVHQLARLPDIAVLEFDNPAYRGLRAGAAQRCAAAQSSQACSHALTPEFERLPPRRGHTARLRVRQACMPVALVI